MNDNVRGLCFELMSPKYEIEDYVNLLIELQEAVSKENNKRRVIKNVGEYFGTHMNLIKGGPFFKKKNTYEIMRVSGTQFLTTFLLSSGYIDSGIRRFNECINALVEFFGAYSSDRSGSGEIISTDEINKIMAIEFVSNASQIIAIKGQISILNMDYVREYNSVSMPLGNIIVNSRPNFRKNGVNDSRYVFMHELGHLFATALSGTYDGIVPNTDKLVENVFRKKIDEIKPEDLPELFADCFTVACAYGTEYESSNPFYKVFRREDIDYINQFMNAFLKPQFALDKKEDA